MRFFEQPTHSIYTDFACRFIPHQYFLSIVRDLSGNAQIRFRPKLPAYSSWSLLRVMRFFEQSTHSIYTDFACRFIPHQYFLSIVRDLSGNAQIRFTPQLPAYSAWSLVRVMRFFEQPTHSIYTDFACRFIPHMVL